MIILVGVDGSETALRAAKKAATLASALEAELHILSAGACQIK
ncbi:universal stress protein [Nesterenkonia sphaerica]|uniref:Universal stress protein n=1 Tax=Nesterenkonia sphaerica TaxID=1804988 RepID=A0A5R8ZYG8_9MICC|nr:universal stress protein [Nesterenkonia sphaerica]